MSGAHIIWPENYFDFMQFWTCINHIITHRIKQLEWKKKMFSVAPKPTESGYIGLIVIHINLIIKF